MPYPQFAILAFNEDNLAKALSNNLTSPSKIKEKRHYRYFWDYLGNHYEDSLHVKTIVIEHDYISKSYLNDYSNFYSSTFTPYDRLCKRVHFFSTPFRKNRFVEAIKDHSHPIWKEYQGYIVIKPLPYMTIGATLLETFKKTDSHIRRYPVTKDYTINLFGKELKINTLAFQEQDSVVGACASCALWCAFHKTASLFITHVPSPSDITKSARNSFQNSGRTYPSKGLDHYQIGNAIESVGLVSELRNRLKRFTPEYIKSFIYAYARMGLPVLLGLSFKDGDHLITVTGYKEEIDSGFTRRKSMALKASKIERFYAHDDQVGPFTKIKIEKDGTLTTSWRVSPDKDEMRTARPVSICVPVHSKIRLTFENVYTKSRFLDFFFLKSFPKVAIAWDIFLCLSNNYKKETMISTTLSESTKYSLATIPLPKYVWIARGIVKGKTVIELLFDATQIATSESCIKINVHDDSLKSVFAVALKEESTKDYLIANLGRSFYDHLRK